METVKTILDHQIETESESHYKLMEKCQICGCSLWKSCNILGRERVVRIKCRCEIEETERKRGTEKSKEKQMRLESIIRNSLMDKKFRDCTFENWDFGKGSKQMYELGKKYAANFKRCKAEGLGLLIYGNPGNGKTYLTSCIANELLKQYVPVICVSINALLGRIQDTYNRWGREAEADVIRSLINADLLIIDDLGTEKSSDRSDWSRSMIYNIIDSRYRSQLPLIITTNLNINLKEEEGILTKRYERRTEDRILEMCTPVFNESKSIRIQEAKKKTDLLREILFKNRGVE